MSLCEFLRACAFLYITNSNRLHILWHSPIPIKKFIWTANYTRKMNIDFPWIALLPPIPKTCHLPVSKSPYIEKNIQDRSKMKQYSFLPFREQQHLRRCWLNAIGDLTLSQNVLRQKWTWYHLWRKPDTACNPRTASGLSWLWENIKRTQNAFNIYMASGIFVNYVTIPLRPWECSVIW